MRTSTAASGQGSGTVEAMSGADGRSDSELLAAMSAGEREALRAVRPARTLAAAAPGLDGAIVTGLLATAALVGGMLWVFKGGAVLLRYDQPEHAFEVAPLLFALVTLGLAPRVPPSRARRIGIVLAVTAVLGGLIAAASSVVTGSVLGAGLLTGTVTMTAALVIVGLGLRRSGTAVGRLLLVLGLGTIPAIAAGGALSLLDERLLEAPIVAIGLVWIAVGLALVRSKTGSPPAM